MYVHFCLFLSICGQEDEKLLWIFKLKMQKKVQKEIL